MQKRLALALGMGLLLQWPLLAETRPKYAVDLGGGQMGMVYLREGGRLLDLYGANSRYMSTFRLQRAEHHFQDTSGSFAWYAANEKGNVILFRDGRPGLVQLEGQAGGAALLAQGLFFLERGIATQEATRMLRQAAERFEAEGDAAGAEQARTALARLEGTGG
ncbi:hypothetical protein [Gloeobacter morelensis]|uniref:Uncharacterized protein n=1 Tax=Gloeobacter morelensis MG652769 TaxID=2781736 RepID=A0ABY3PN42_9CYAN|nr:hypothetical protein [Gloeobacter morelensis]UFP95061.1 hypothetical protein ISF26_02085 [Gloeobacter morelensis MG652769]